MNKQQSFEQQVTSWMAAEVTKPPEWLLDHILASTARQRPLPRWLALLKERPMRSSSRIIAGSPARRLVFSTILIVLLGAVVAGIGALLWSNPGPDEWPGFRGGVDRTGAGLTGPVGNPVLDWRFSAQGAIGGSAAIAGDSVFVTSDDGVLHALAIGDGREIWTYRSATGPLSGPLAIDGRVYISSEGAGAILALDSKTGSVLWTAAISFTAASELTAGNGRVYLATGTGTMVAINVATGSVQWQKAITSDGSALHHPAFADGIIYVAGDTAGLLAIDAASGATRWTVPTDGDITGTAVVSGGLAYIGATSDSTTGHLRAVTTGSGVVEWTVDEAFYAPAIANGTAYTVTAQGAVAALDLSTGAVRWRAQLKGKLRAPVVAGKMIYVAANDEQRIYAFDASTGAILWSFDVDGRIDCCLAVAHGIVFVGTTTGSLYAISGDGKAVRPLPSSGATGSATPLPSTTATAAPTPRVTAAPPLATATWSATTPDPKVVLAGLARAPDGRLWVADVAGGRFAIFSPDGTFEEFWGQPGSGDGQFNLVRSNGDPYGTIAFASDGSFFVLDVGNRRVQAFDTSRHLITSWGGFGTGLGSFNDPVGIAVAPSGNVSVLDDRRAVIETYDPTGTVLGSFAPLDGVSDGSNGLAIDSHGNFYVSTINPNTVRRFDPSGKLTGTFGATGSGPGAFNEQPTEIAVAIDGRIFVTQGTGRGSAYGVLAFDATGTYLGGFGTLGVDVGQLGFPWGIAADEADGIYVAEFGPSDRTFLNRLQKFELVTPAP